MTLRGFVRETGQPITPVKITNISTDGCRFISEATFETATVIWVKIDGLGAQRARVAWSKDQAYGCEFLSAIEFAVWDSFLERRAA